MVVTVLRRGLLAAVVALGALGARAETVLRSVPQLDVKLLDPYQNTNYGTRNHGHMIYETLFAWDSKLQPHPQMVDSYSVSDDGLTWSFTLRPGLAWQDGTAVTGNDVIASLEKFLRKDGYGQKLGRVVAAMETRGQDGFVLKLKEPFPLVPVVLGKESNFPAFIIPERFAKMPDGSPDFQPIGSGPFIFQRAQWQPGQRNVYLRNPAYKPRAEKPDGFAGGRMVHVDRVEWITMPDTNTAVNALLAGEVDWIESVGFDQIAQLEAEKDVTVVPSDPLGSQSYLRANWKLPPFDNVKARQALLYLNDKDEYGMAATGDKRFYLACPALFMCGAPFETLVGAIKPDLARAKQLMQEAGYKGEKIVMMEPTTVPQFDAATQVTAAQLRKIGVNVELVPMDYNAMMSRRASKAPIDKGGWNLFHSGNFGIDVASPMTNVYLNASCDEAAPGWPCDEKIEALKDAFLKAKTDEERMRIVEQIQLRAFEVVPYVNVVQLRAFTAYRKGITGVLPSPVQLYWNVEKHG